MRQREQRIEVNRKEERTRWKIRMISTNVSGKMSTFSQNDSPIDEIEFKKIYKELTTLYPILEYLIDLIIAENTMNLEPNTVQMASNTIHLNDSSPNPLKTAIVPSLEELIDSTYTEYPSICQYQNEMLMSKNWENKCSIDNDIESEMNSQHELDKLIDSACAEHGLTNEKPTVVETITNTIQPHSWPPNSHGIGNTQVINPAVNTYGQQMQQMTMPFFILPCGFETMVGSISQQLKQSQPIDSTNHYKKRKSSDESIADTNLLKKPKREYKCKLCDYIGKTAWAVKVHNRSHTSPKTFKCDICTLELTTKRYLNQHIKRHEFPFKCTVCELGFKQRADKEAHENKLSCKRPRYKCNLCKFRAINKLHYQKHMSTHT